MPTSKKLLILCFCLFLGLGILSFFVVFGGGGRTESTAAVTNTISLSTMDDDPSPALQPVPAQKTLPTNYHIFQSFNNCAPAALSMALSYYGVRVSQEALAADLRPYNNPTGKNDDKSTTPEELGEKARSYGLTPYYRANGTFERMEQFIANGMPIVVRTLLYPDKDFAHYRIIKGYDKTTRELIQDDSLQGKNLRYSYDAFSKLWRQYNYEYLVLVPADKRDVANAILGEETDPVVSWKHAVARAEDELEQNPESLQARFNLSVSLYHAGEYKRSVQEFEKIEARMPTITLWYRIEPVLAYSALGNHARVFELAGRLLHNNLAFSEMYLLRGKSYLAQGDTAAARTEFEKAVLYNKNSASAREALNSL